MLEDPVVRRWMDEGRIVRTRPLPRIETPPQFADFDGECFEHERIPFVSQPAEWAPEMLAAAGSLTLALSRALLPRGWQLKDATPANVLFRNSEPVFVDLPSIIPREPGSCLWIARHQFETTFLLPLIASVEAGLPIAWTLSNPVAGLSHESLAGILGARRWLKPALWRAVALPAALAAQGRLRRRRAAGDESRERGAGAFHPRAIAEGTRAAAFALRRRSSRPEAPTGTATRRRAVITAPRISKPSARSSRTRSRAPGRAARSTSARTRASTARSPRARATSSRSTSTSARSPRSGRARAAHGSRSCRSSAISAARRRRSDGATASSSRCSAAPPAVSTSC